MKILTKDGIEYEIETFTKSGVDYMTHKDALLYYGCTPVTLKNWRDNGKIKFYTFPLNSGRLYAVDPEVRKYHLGGERFDRRKSN